MKDGLRCKAEGYGQIPELFDDGVLWSAMFELLVIRSERVPKQNMSTEQWAQPADAVVLVALWMCARLPSEMKLGPPWRLAGWNPLL